MATIGSGTKVIPNVVSTATWRSVDADQGLAAFAEQLGGIGWSGGVPQIYGGNIDSSNFASGMALGSSYIVAPYGEFCMSFGTRDDPSTGSPLYYGMVPCDALVRNVAIGAVVAAGASYVSGMVKVLVNGKPTSTVSIDATQVATTANNAAWSSKAPFLLPSGSVVSFSMDDILVGASKTPYTSAAASILLKVTMSLRGAVLLRAGT